MVACLSAFVCVQKKEKGGVRSSFDLCVSSACPQCRVMLFALQNNAKKVEELKKTLEDKDKAHKAYV